VLVLLAGCSKQVQLPDDALVERDRDLYETAMQMMEKSRYTAAQIQLNVLMSTYPDSEFAPQAKYAFAESKYREGGGSNLTEAELHFKDFITFFPTSELADDAQLMVAMTHVRQLQKPDRDDTQARLAEYELTAMIDKYPASQLLDETKAKLREVQEILAESVFGPARFYYRQKAYLAVIDRCEEILKKYPDFSDMDRVLYLMAEAERRIDNIPASLNHYSQIVRDYPLSESVDDARKRLVELNASVPDANPVALERARQRQPEGGGMLSWLGFGLFGGGPEISKDTNAASMKDKGGELSIEQGQP
jgi:outer membrane protein assembly factor BamD